VTIAPEHCGRWTGVNCAPGSGLLDAALFYAARGWSIVPVIGKRAAGLWQPFQERRPDEPALRRMFSRPKITGLAVITGLVSGGLAVRDFDDAGAYQAWARTHPEDAGRLPTVRTSRGYHLYARLDAEQYRTLPDGELRADSKHYVVLPPSLHPDGTIYAWTVPLPEGELPVLPHSLSDTDTQADPADPSRCKTTQTSKTSIACWTSAIADTLPSGPGQRNLCIFAFARRLKAMRPDATAAELRPAVRAWHEQALPHIRTKGFGETWTDFAVAWERIKRPAGQSFRAAAEAADASEVLPAIVGQLGYDGHLARLVVLCYQLAQQWGKKPFPLGCEIAGQYLGVTTRQAGRLLNTLSFDGVIELANPHDRRNGKAREWRFMMEQGGE
jgi:hypothetical protein